MKKRLLILGAGHDQLFMIRTARRLGLHTIAFDWNVKAPGFAEVDEYAQISTRNLSEMKAYVDSYIDRVGPIHGVSTMGSDIPHIVSALARHIGTPSISEQSASWATDKFQMKERFRQANVRTPLFQLVGSPQVVREVFMSHNGPMVLKPIDQAGSRGVSLIRSLEEVDKLYDHAKSNSSSESVLLESFIDGPQISTESLMINGEIYTPGYADRNYDQLNEFLPFIMENGGWVPSLYESQRSEVELEVKKAALSLGVVNGVVKGDVVLSVDGPVIIEIAARLSGGDFSESLVPLGLGVNYVEAVIKMAINESFSLDKLRPRFNTFVANRYFFAPAGILRAIHGLDKVVGKDWIAKLKFWYRPGDHLPDIHCHGQRTGVFVVTGPDRKTVQQRIDFVYDSVKLEVF